MGEHGVPMMFKRGGSIKEQKNASTVRPVRVRVYNVGEEVPMTFRVRVRIVTQ